MKVLFLANASSIHTVRWVNELALKGLEVHLAYKYDDNPREQNISRDVILHRLKYSGTKGYFVNALELRRIYNDINPDIVNAHYASGYGTLARLSRMKPLVLSSWGSDVYDFPYQSKLKRKLIVDNLMYADTLASTSIVMADQIRKLIDCSKDTIKITPFGVNTNLFYNKHNKDFSNENEITIGSIKALTPKYGIKYGILSIDYLINKLIKEDFNYKIKYVIYGDGIEREDLESLVEDKKLEDIVEFRGRIPNDQVPDALSELDIFLGTSVMDSESFGVAIVEAMACEVPVIVTDVDGFSEVVDKGKCGIMVKREDYKSMAEKIHQLIINPQERMKLGKSERERVLRLYDWSSNVDTMIDIYKKTSKIMKE
jgi:L-malate glycosyltransferase